MYNTNMVKTECRSFGERNGSIIRRVGLAGMVAGAIGRVARSEFAADLIIAGAVVFLAGHVMKEAGQKRRERLSL